MTCDFCGEEANQPTLFEAAPFAISREGTPTFLLANPWAACRICAGLISSGQREKLLIRGIEMQLTAHVRDHGLVNVGKVVAYVKAVQEGFHASRQQERES